MLENMMLKSRWSIIAEFEAMRHRAFFLWILLTAFGMIFSADGIWGKEEALYNSHARRDPFIPLVTMTTRESSGLYGVESVNDIVIEGLVNDLKKGSVVVLNGSVMRVGDEVGNVKVLAIKPDGVSVSINGVQQFKPMYQEEAK